MLAAAEQEVATGLVPMPDSIFFPGLMARRHPSISPRICGAAADGLIVIGAETTLLNPVGRAERKGLVFILAAASTLVVMLKRYVLPPAKGGRVTEVDDVPNAPIG